MDKNTRKSSFGKWVSPINTKKLLEQVEKSKQDSYTKKLTTEAYIKIMLLAQLHGSESLEEMSDALIDDGLQKALGFESISPSQLSRKNNELLDVGVSRQQVSHRSYQGKTMKPVQSSYPICFWILCAK